MRLNDMLGIQFPIIQGGMANIATGEFAAAVSNAGALGLIGAGGMTADILRQQIHVCRELTDKPFGVNIMLMHPQAPEMARIVAEENIPVVTTGAGNPSEYVAMWKAAGCKVFPVIPAVALAKRLADRGVDGVIAEGTESGVQVGTCLLGSVECPIHDNYKAAILKAKDSDTIVTGRFGGTPVRVLKNKMSREYVRQEKAGATKEELEHLTLGGLRRAVFDGDTDTGSVMAGQVAGMVREIRPLRVIFEEMVAQSQACLEALEKESKR